MLQCLSYVAVSFVCCSVVDVEHTASMSKVCLLQSVLHLLSDDLDKTYVFASVMSHVTMSHVTMSHEDVT